MIEQVARRLKTHLIAPILDLILNFEDDLKMEDAYKLEHERFIVNRNGTGSPEDIFILATINTSSSFLITLALSFWPILTKKRYFNVRILFESFVLFGTFITVITIFAEWLLLITAIIWTLNVFLLIKLGSRKNIKSLRWTEFLYLEDPNLRYSIHTKCMANTLVSTTISILAVDFKIFPRSFAKTEKYGFSLMDTGAPFFVVLNGVFAPEVRYDSNVPINNRLAMITKTFYSSIPLLILAFQRLYVVKSLNYQSQVTEYGVHWNFFFTLTFTKIFGSLILSLLPKRISITCVAGFMICLYQLFLAKSNLAEFIQNDDRDGLIAANKEGIFSVVGYLALYLVSIDGGRYANKKFKTGRPIDFLHVFAYTSTCFIMYGCLSILSHMFIETVSRRETNLTFILWILTISMLSAASEIAITIIQICLQEMGLIIRLPESAGLLNESVSYTALIFFLFANLMTGLFNFSFNTISASNIKALVILFSYASILSYFAAYCHKYNFNMRKLKNLINNLIKFERVKDS